MSERNLKLVGIVVIIAIVFALHVKLYRFSTITQHGALQTLVCLGRVIKVDTSDDVDQILTLRILSGRFRGATAQTNNIWIGRQFSDRVIHKGDVLFLEIPLRHPDQMTIDKVHMRQYFRTPFLLYLAGLLGCLMILVAGMKGVRAILTLFVTAIGVLYILIPMTMNGFNPIAVALLVASLLTLATFVLITGFSPKVISGALGTLGGLIAVAVLSVISQKVMIFTGLAQDFGFLELGTVLWRETTVATLTKGAVPWNFTGILAAGMILGAVGAMMDVGMSISSSVYEVKQVNPNITVRAAIRAGMNVGRDIMGTMADTLIFAYLGAHMITMLLPQIDFPEVGVIYPFLQLANDEATAVAITQAIVGTIGLVLTVPIAATIAGFLTQYIKVKPSDIHQDLPSAEELEELFRSDDPKSKARLAVPLALTVVLLATLFLHHRVNRASATIVEQFDENGELASRSEYAKGKVIRLLESNALNETIEHHILEIELLSGLYKGQRIMMRNVVNNSMPSLSIPARPGDFVLCRVGGTPDQIGVVNLVQEFGRDGFLIWLLGLMMVLIIIVGRIEGIRTACAMVMSGLILYFFMLPRISQGDNAVIIVTVTAGLIAFVSLVFVIGPSRKTFSAVLGTMGSIFIAGLIVMFAQGYLHFSGQENAISVDIIEATRKPPFDFRQVLLAGMLMGVLGVAIDGAIEVASSMEEIRRANPSMPTWRLIASGMNVGTDILGTMVNTLVFAYLGVEFLFIMAVKADDLQLFLEPPIQLLSIGMVSAEIVRLLAGTLGLVLAIPLTAIISAFWNLKKGSDGM